LDLVGLGSTSLVKTNKEWRNNIDFATQYPYNQYSLILIYDLWFDIESEQDYTRLGWTKVGELKIENNVVCACNVVSFYTSDPAMVKELRENLSQFRNMVPRDVTVTVFEN
jgi:hypothetical protein